MEMFQFDKKNHDMFRIFMHGHLYSFLLDYVIFI